LETIFSKIINKKIPCHLVAENKVAISFMDINPIQKGHVLVVPKLQVDYLFDLDEKTYHDLWSFTKIIADALKKTIPCKRIGVSVIGFEVPHAHIHLIPINNVVDMNFTNKIKTNSTDLAILSKIISNNLR
tara:strand:+ start:515 stop:907 length:393 start_codon:yes stop_codon:yes gene_type:complete